MLKIEYVHNGRVMSESELKEFKGKFIINQNVKSMEASISALSCHDHETVIRYYASGKAAVIPCCKNFIDKIKRNLDGDFSLTN